MLSSNIPIWKTNQENTWGLYNHTDYKLPVHSEKPTDTKQQKEKTKAKQPTDTPFYFNKLKQETKGTTICTPKGYGIIQSIDPEKNTITVKVQGIIHDFDKSEAMTEVPISVIYLKESMKTEETIYLPVNSTMKEVFERVESSVNTEESWVDIKVFFQGKELEKTEETLEKLKVTPFSKFLTTYTPGKPMTIKRFNHANQGWCVAYSTNIDAISFQCSKTIRVIGFGVYPIINNDTAAAKVTLYGGDNVKGQVLYCSEMNVVKNAGEPDNSVSRIMFNKPYTCKAGEYFSCAISFLVSGNSYYGSGGQVKMDGEGEVTFNFKNCVGANNGTGTSSGQIPEIYYYV